MAQASRHSGLTGSALVRLVAQLTGPEAHEAPRPPFSERLTQWLGWTDAIALSAALEGQATTARAAPGRGSSAHPDEDCAQVRAALVRSIVEGDAAATSPWQRGHPSALAATVTPEPPVEFAPYRQRYLARQQAMAADIAALRGRLRSLLAARSPALSRLAAVDAVMAQALGVREQAVLSTLPALLERRFQHLRRTHAPPSSDDPPAKSGATPAWLALFHQDMQAVLLAELDLRFQPVEGLAGALRSSPPSSSPSPA